MEIEEADPYVLMWKENSTMAYVSRILDACACVYMCVCPHMYTHTFMHAYIYIVHRCLSLFKFSVSEYPLELANIIYPKCTTQNAYLL